MSLSIASVLTALAAFAGFLGAVGLGSELAGLVRGGRQPNLPGRPAGVRVGARALVRRLGRLVAAAPPIRGLSPAGDLEARLVAAGEPAGLGLREWIALKVACAVLGGLVAGLVASGAPARVAVFSMLVAPVAGFVAPEFWLARRSRQRIDAAVRELPDMLDLLRVTVEGGMAPARAIGVVATEFQGTLAGEWRRVTAEIELGVAQDEALAGLRARLPADELGSLVESLNRARRHGVPLGRTLALQAGKARESRRRRVREQAARAGPMIQLVVALVLVPAVLLVVAAGVLVEIQRSGSWLPTG